MDFQIIQSDLFYKVMMNDDQDGEDLTIHIDPNNFANAGNNTGALFFGLHIHV
eukprot:CAMPEP_0194300926 /NCGR_PEP_ID=MMETSP0169-20130528/61527_1 /TAXON_ID=218684 /ORGANISM="Corethron pennatum, Strain L29A3" /LENGTH=52 /DNA_ID=CAMNT_0039051149 /DNA_START=892 /DNA_END=1050 /DNA_ORIENTATION=+